MSTSDTNRSVSPCAHQPDQTLVMEEKNIQSTVNHNSNAIADCQLTENNGSKSLAHMHDVHALTASDIEKRLNAAEYQSQVNGVRFTSLRRNVYQLILESDKPLGAYDLIQRLQTNRVQKQGEQAKMVAPPTVYRTLDFLLNMGFIHQLTSINAFVPCCHPRDQHNAVFLLCDVCQHVQECSGLPVQEVTSYVKADLGFQVEHSIMELKGRCQNCLSDTTSNTTSS